MAKSSLATIDPGQDAGLAWFQDGQLIGCSLNVAPWFGWRFDRLVVEIPNANEKRKGKNTNPQSLISLAITAGRWIERVQHATLHTQFAAEWKAGVPKEQHNGRVLAALNVHELQVLARGCSCVPVGKRHNIVDAIGIGLEYLGRIGRGGRATG